MSSVMSGSLHGTLGLTGLTTLCKFRHNGGVVLHHGGPLKTRLALSVLTLKAYRTLSLVENAFRTLKHALSLQAIFHHRKDRTAGHCRPSAASVCRSWIVEASVITGAKTPTACSD